MMPDAIPPPSWKVVVVVVVGGVMVTDELINHTPQC